MADWLAPDPNLRELDIAAHQTTTFLGQYREVPPIWDTFVTIQAGNFLMGAPPDEPGSDCPFCNEYPQHEVTLPRSFLLQATEVTNRQYVDLANWALGEGVARADLSATGKFPIIRTGSQNPHRERQECGSRSQPPIGQLHSR